MQRQQTAMTQAADPAIVNKFKAGFSECAKEVDRFQGLEPIVKRRLLQHLSAYLTGCKSENITSTSTASSTTTPQPPQLQPVQIHMLPSSPPGSPEQNSQSSTNSNPSAASIHGTRQQQTLKITNPAQGYYLTLPNGVLTYVSSSQLTTSASQPIKAQQMPTLVPIPCRTSSTASAASNTSSAYERLSARDSTSNTPISSYSPPSPANSYEAMDFQNNSHSTSSSTSQFHSQPQQHQQTQRLQHHYQHQSQHNHHQSTFHHQQQQQQQQQNQKHQQSRLGSGVHSMDEDYDEDDDISVSSEDETIGEQRSANCSPVPLSLVMKRSAAVAEIGDDDEERPWRPW